MIIPNTLLPTADVATTGSDLGYTFTPGTGTTGVTDGVGDTLEGSNNTALTVDGVTIVVGNIVLVKDQTTITQNGLYLCTRLQASGVGLVLTRHPNLSNSASFNYTMLAVSRGTVNANTLWMFNYVSGFTVNSSNVVFTQLGPNNSPVYANGTISSSSFTFNAALGKSQSLTLGHNITLSFTNIVSGGTYTLIVTQGSGPYSITLPSSSPYISKVSGNGGGAVVLSQTSGYIDILSFFYDGTNVYVTYGTTFN